MQQIVHTRQGDMCIRPYHEADEVSALKSWQASFNHPLSKELWRWKYINGPFKHQLMICVAESGDIAALYGGIPYEASYQGKTQVITHLMDNMSHPDYRGVIGGRNGVFVQTVNAFFDHFGQRSPNHPLFVYGFPGDRHMRLGKCLLGYETLSNGMSFLQLETVGYQPPRLRLRSQMYKLECVREVDARFDRLQQTLRPDYPLAVIRDQKFLQWRFLDHPVREYEIWIYRRRLSSEIEGYLVVSVDGQSGRATLVDHQLPRSEVLAAKFLQSMLYALKDRGFSQMQTWLPGDHFSGNAFQLAGFREHKEPTGITPAVRTFFPDFTQPDIAGKLFYSMADADLF